MIDRIVAFFEKWLPVFTVIVFMAHYTTLKIYFNGVISSLKTYALLMIGILFIVNFIRSSQKEKLDWLKQKNIGIPSIILLMLYFIIRFVTLAYYDFDHGILHEIVFEGICLVAFSTFTMTKSTDFKLVAQVFIAIITLLNIVNDISYLLAQEALSSGNLYSKLDMFLMEFNSNANKGIIYTNPNTGGVLTGLAILMALLFIKKENRKTFMWLTMIWIINLISVYILFARSSFVALFIALLSMIILVVVKKAEPKVLVNICLISCIIVSGLIFTLIQINLKDGTQLSETESKINSLTTTRYQIWQDALVSHQNCFILGTGSYEIEIDSRNEYLKNAYLEQGGSEEDFMPTIFHLHSGYFGVLYYTGIIGFVLFFILIIDKVLASKVLNMEYVMRRDAIIFAAILIYLLVTNLVEPYFIGKRHIEFIFLVLILSLDREKLDTR